MRLLKVLSCLLLASGVAAAAAADPSLVTAYGKVEIGHGTPPVWRVAQSGDALAPGDSVRTSAGARAELQLGDNRIVRVYEQSVLRVGTSVTPTGAVRSVDLDQGQSIFDVMKKTVADEFDVMTPEVVVSVKGTRFLVAAVEGADYTSVFRGVVGLAGEGFEAVSVRPGMTGAHGELFLTPFADPWTAWETGSSAPAPAVDEGHEAEVGTAIQAAIGGSGADASEDTGLLGGLLAGLFGSPSDSGAGDGTSAAESGQSSDGGGLLAGLVGGVSEPVASLTDDGSLLGGTTEAVGDLLVTDPVGSLLAPVTDPVGSLTPALTDPAGGGGSLLSPVGGLLDGLLGGTSSP
jgi:FecR protein